MLGRTKTSNYHKKRRELPNTGFYIPTTKELCLPSQVDLCTSWEELGLATRPTPSGGILKFRFKSYVSY
jgi:hypothetical protein